MDKKERSLELNPTTVYKNIYFNRIDLFYEDRNKRLKNPLIPGCSFW